MKHGRIKMRSRAKVNTMSRAVEAVIVGKDVRYLVASVADIVDRRGGYFIKIDYHREGQQEENFVMSLVVGGSEASQEAICALLNKSDFLRESPLMGGGMELSTPFRQGDGFLGKTNFKMVERKGLVREFSSIAAQYAELTCLKAEIRLGELAEGGGDAFVGYAEYWTRTQRRQSSFADELEAWKSYGDLAAAQVGEEPIESWDITRPPEGPSSVPGPVGPIRRLPAFRTISHKPLSDSGVFTVLPRNMRIRFDDGITEEAMRSVDE